MYLEKSVCVPRKIGFFIIGLAKDFSKIVLCMPENAQPTMFQHQKKIISEKTKKIFFILLHISQNPGLGVKIKFPPFSRKRFSRSG